MASKKGQQAAQNAVTRHQVYLERLKAGYVRDFDKTVNQIQRRILSIVRELEVDDMSELTRSELRVLQSRLRTAQLDIYAKNIDILTDELKDLAEFEATHQADVLQKGIRARSTKKVPVLKSASRNKAFLRGLQHPVVGEGMLLDPFFKRVGEATIERVAGVINVGWAEGKTVGEMTRQIRGTKARNFKDGLLVRSRREAEAMVRTATQHVANQARMATWEANDDIVTSYRYVATLDRVTTTICRSLDGRVFKINKGPVPPQHVNCRSTTIAELSKEFDFLSEGRTRSAETGPIRDKNYYDWLKTQNAAFQKDALGAKRAKLFRDGGLSATEFARLNLDKNFKPLTLKEMKRKNPGAFKQASLDS